MIGWPLCIRCPTCIVLCIHCVVDCTGPWVLGQWCTSSNQSSSAQIKEEAMRTNESLNAVNPSSSLGVSLQAFKATFIHILPFYRKWDIYLTCVTRVWGL